MLTQIRFVLIGTSHPGNIGAAARAMKCMGLSNLALVEPRSFPHIDAYSRAAGAEDVLDGAAVHSSLKQAIQDCVFVVGTTGRTRSIPWPVVAPGRAARSVVRESAKGPVAVLFGREQSGLTNIEVDACHRLVQIPTVPEFSSLNLASAAQVMAYELFLAAGRGQETSPTGEDYADAVSMDQFYQHLEQTLHELDFVKVKHRPVKLMRKLVRLFNRARPTNEEINILRGVLSAAQSRRRA